jgi:hypothetical protein
MVGVNANVNITVVEVVAVFVVTANVPVGSEWTDDFCHKEFSMDADLDKLVGHWSVKLFFWNCGTQHQIVGSLLHGLVGYYSVTAGKVIISFLPSSVERIDLDAAHIWVRPGE